MKNNNYYISSFFWSTTARILNAIIGFFSVPLLLGCFGKANYGILSLATACNGYMHLLDLGMNVGSVRHFARWRAEGNFEMIRKVAHTNISFYMIIAAINVIALLILAYGGESLFSVTHEQFLLLQKCILILAFFSIFNWVTTAFHQLLVAYEHTAFCMQMQCLQHIFKGITIAIVLWTNMSLQTYFFLITMLVAMLLIPYAYKCLHDKLIDSIYPQGYWTDFKVVLTFSLSIFALSLFQMTATQSRPIILSIFAIDGASSVADFKIIETIPSFLIMLGGSLSAIFLPKTSEIVAQKDQKAIERFAYSGTIMTTIITNFLCMPFILGGKEILTAYVGSSFNNLCIWLNIWLICVLCQIHSTPANALILAYGKTKILVYASALGCIISIIINALFAKEIGAGSAVVGYGIYILINLSAYYFFFYKKLLGLKKMKIFSSFAIPTLIGALLLGLINIINLEKHLYLPINNERWYNVTFFTIKAIIWGIMYVICLYTLNIARYKNGHFLTKYDNQ